MKRKLLTLGVALLVFGVIVSTAFIRLAGALNEGYAWMCRGPLWSANPDCQVGSTAYALATNMALVGLAATFMGALIMFGAMGRRLDDDSR